MSVVMPPDAAAWWLRLARGDLAAARRLQKADGVTPRPVAYLAQQAAEKALKATLALEGGSRPRRTTWSS
jgi:HEPN domain-containing protein